MSITIDRLILEANTADGLYGLDITLSKGLFILRVENSHGKSTFINSIAYALGMEMALGQQTSKPPFPPSLLKSIQDKNGSEKLVISSHVMIQITNHKSETFTLKRNILGADADSIISIYQSDMNSISGDGQKFFLHMEGDTTRELGFYRWLTGFLDWDLPMVPNNHGGESPLYPALLFPLFFVEQKRGWGSIQATSPFHFQISQAKKRAFEFIMRLDVNETIKKKAKNQSLIDETKEKWETLYSQLEIAAARLGGKVSGVSESPSAKFESSKLDILLEDQQEWKYLSSSIEYKRMDLKTHILKNNNQNALVSEESKIKNIRVLNDDLLAKQNTQESISDEISFLKNQIESTRKRIENLTDDKRKYEDLRKVKGFIALKGLPVLNNECPTCGREYSDHSIEFECANELMTLDESLGFIKNQISTFNSVLQSYSTQLDIKAIELKSIESAIDRCSEDISRIKKSIYSDKIVVDEEYIREKIRLENQIKSYEEELVSIAELRSEFDRLHIRHKELIRLRRDFPEYGFSSNDIKKLESLNNRVIDYLAEFGFSSFDPKLLSISRDSYLPTREGFDLGFDTSASDGIRVIWSYLIGIFSLREEFKTNHPGVLIFDEPRQQEANKLSFTGLLRGAAHAANSGQIIFATSEEDGLLRDALEGCEYNLISFSPSDGKILRKR